MNKKLLPCPFCGGMAVIVQKNFTFEIKRSSVICGQCCCATAWELDETDAIFKWNRRKNTGTKLKHGKHQA